MKPHLHVNPRCFQQWQKQRYAGPGPYKVTPTGHVFIITPADSDRLNIAHGRDGAVWFTSRSHAEYVLSLGLLPAS